MGLSVLERIVLLQLLPTEGDIQTLRVSRATREVLEFTPDEVASLSLKQLPESVEWNPKAEQVADLPLDVAMTDLITERLKALSNAGRLRDHHVPLYERFVEGL